MTLVQQIITVAICAIATMLTRFLPFIIFKSDKPIPPVIRYLGKVLPAAVFGMLVVYCLKNVEIIKGTHGIPEFCAILITVLIHLWRKNMMLSICIGTICYILLLRFIF